MRPRRSHVAPSLALAAAFAPVVALLAIGSTEIYVEGFYRAAWSHDRALGLLRDGAGAQFDVRCVGALEHVLERRPGAVLLVAV